MCVVFNNNITEGLHYKSRYIDVACEQCNYHKKSFENRCLTIPECLPTVLDLVQLIHNKAYLRFQTLVTMTQNDNVRKEYQGNKLLHVLT